jgi:hypothetical protein
MKGPGVGVEPIKEIEEAAAAYMKERDKRCAITPKEVEKKNRLIDLLHANVETIGRDGNGILRYEMDDGHVIELKPGKETLKIAIVDGDAEKTGD